MHVLRPVLPSVSCIPNYSHVACYDVAVDQANPISASYNVDDKVLNMSSLLSFKNFNEKGALDLL